jgi:hypothetical protein
MTDEWFVLDLASMSFPSSSVHEVAQKLPAELETANLNFLDAKSRFTSKRTNDDQEWPTGEYALDAKFPAALAANVKDQRVSDPTFIPYTCSRAPNARNM